MHSKTAVANATQHNYPVTEQGANCITVEAPGGYKFTLVDQDVNGGNKRYVMLKHLLHISDLYMMPDNVAIQNNLKNL